MKPTKYSNPFTPGFGAIPPYLAGRADEQDLFRNNLANMSAGRSPSAPIILYGPRGVGKTVLLNWFEDEVQQGGAKKNKIRVVKTVPNALESQSDLWKSLLNPSIWKSHNLSRSTVQEDLIKQCKKRPLVYLIDEAHRMDSDVCNHLLNLHQRISFDAPFMLVLAGTPGLRHFLSNVGASFIERARYIGVGRLDEQASADAISKPLQEQGIQITEDALSIIVEDSQCYPYFLQLWGSSLWDEADKENVTCITEEQVAVVKPDITIIKKDFYNDRRDKLTKLELRPTAVAIARAFQDTKEMSKDMIMEIIRDNLSVDSLNTQSDFERLQTFIDNDFIWQSQKSILYEPGIPSFMTHILDQQPSLGKTK